MTALQPKNESLWQIEETLENLVQLRAQAEAEGDSEALKAIDAETEKYLDKQPAKVDSYCALIRRNGSAADECEKEARRLMDRAKALRNEEQRLKDTALRVMQNFGVRVLESKTNRLRVQANGGVEPLLIAEWPCDSSGRYTPIPAFLATELPDKFKKVLALPNAEAIREALKRGEQVPGARLLERGSHLRVE